MNCGDSLVCELLKYSVEILEVAGVVVAQRVGEHLKELSALIAICFGIWKWWNFREKVLHKRLKEYVEAQNARLAHARAHAVEALHRPTSERAFGGPIFVQKHLKKVLRRSWWSRLLRALKFQTSADKLLDTAIAKLDGQLTAAQQQLDLLRAQRASAHMLKGAIASARGAAIASPGTRTELDQMALQQFRHAMAVPGHQTDLELQEYEAVQLRKLGDLGQADEAYEVLEKRLLRETSSRERDLRLARVKLGRALIAQRNAILKKQKGKQSTMGAAAAYGMLLGPSVVNAIELRKAYGPYSGWDAADQGHLHYATAYVCRNMDYNPKEREHLDLAEGAYNCVLAAGTAGQLSTWSGRRQTPLMAAALAGVERVKTARNCDYDVEWLLPPPSLQKTIELEDGEISAGSPEPPAAQS